MISQILGIDLRPLIDNADFDEVAQRAAAYLKAPSEHYQLFGAGWNGLGYRAVGADTHASEFRAAFKEEPAASPNARLVQEMSFFDCVLNTSAAAENLVFACYPISASASSANLAEKLLKMSRLSMVQKIKAASHTAALGAFLEQCFAEQACEGLYGIRDFLVHRGRLARNHFVGGEFHGLMTVARNMKARPADWQNNLVFGQSSLDDAVAWLGRYIRGARGELLKILPPLQVS